MAEKQSAGLLMYRRGEDAIEVFLVHPGGPFWTKKDAGVWTIPKGEYQADEDALAAARREFTEETSFTAEGPFRKLDSIQQKSGKVVTAWACEGDCDPRQLVSNTCLVDWPPRSGKKLEIPEVDRGEWFGPAAAREKIRPEQAVFLNRLDVLLSTKGKR